MQYKTCSRCHNEFELTSDNFYRYKKSRDGYDPICKSCHNERYKIWSDKNPGKVKGYKDKYAENNPDKIKEAKQKWFDKNPEYKREHYLKHKDRYTKSNSKRYYDNREHALSKMRENYKKRRESIKVKAKMYATQKPYIFKMTNIRRMRRINELPHEMTDDRVEFCINYFDNKCAVCGRSMNNGYKLSLDHWIPLNDPNCPGTIVSNIVPLCHGKDGTPFSCNNTKNKQDHLVWLRRKYSDSEVTEIVNRINEYFRYAKSYWNLT